MKIGAGDLQLINRRFFLPVAGRVIQLPCFFPSISSVKTNLSPLEYLKILVTVKNPTYLISAFDIFHSSVLEKQEMENLIQESRESGATVLMDSGNYESYWKNNISWSLNSFHKVLDGSAAHFCFSFDNQNPDVRNDINVTEIEERVLSHQKYSVNTSIAPIIHGTSEQLPDIATLVCQRLQPLLIAVPERELGQGIIGRAKTVIRIRKRLNEAGIYFPLHLLGTGNPIAILIYSVCGADSFDGLEWCQTTVDYETGQLHHFQLRELFGDQSVFCSMNIPYTQATLAHNLLYYRKLMELIQKALSENNVIDLVEKLLPERILAVLKEYLPEVFAYDK